jgi:hypothetical protein
MIYGYEPSALGQQAGRASLTHSLPRGGPAGRAQPLRPLLLLLLPKAQRHLHSPFRRPAKGAGARRGRASAGVSACGDHDGGGDRPEPCGAARVRCAGADLRGRELVRETAARVPACVPARLVLYVGELHPSLWEARPPQDRPLLGGGRLTARVALYMLWRAFRRLNSSHVPAPVVRKRSVRPWEMSLPPAARAAGTDDPRSLAAQAAQAAAKAAEASAENTDEDLSRYNSQRFARFLFLARVCFMCFAGSRCPLALSEANGALHSSAGVHSSRGQTLR